MRKTHFTPLPEALGGGRVLKGGIAALLACLALPALSASADTYTVTTDVGAIGTYNWNSLPWSPSVPVGAAGDTFNMTLTAGTVSSGDVRINLQSQRTVGVFNASQTNAFNLRLGATTGESIVFDSGTSGVAAQLNTTRVQGANVTFMLRCYVDADVVLNSSLNVTHDRLNFNAVNDRGGFTGVISGAGKLTLGFTNPNATAASTYTFGKAGGAENTYSGGTQINGFNTTVSFVAAKTNAFGTGPLGLNTAKLDLKGFNQTVGGLADGAGSSIITNTGTARTLTLDFDSLIGPQAFDGALQGAALLSITKKGTGVQTLSGTNNTYTGATNILGGSLVVNGSLSGTSSITAGDGINAALLGGNGTLTPASGGTVTVKNAASLAPSAGGLTINANASASLDLQAGSKLELSIANSQGAGNPALSGDFSKLTLGTGVSATIAGEIVTTGFTGVQNGDLFTVIVKNGSDNGNRFSNTTLFAGSTYKFTSNGQQWLINYQYSSAGAAAGILGNDFAAITGGSNIALLAIPEPGALVSLLGGFVALLGFQRRRRPVGGM